MKSSSNARNIARLAAACALIALTGCGGGGGGDGQSAGTPPPSGGTPPPPPPPPPPEGTSASVPFTAGKRWLYEMDRTNTVVATSTGVHTSTFAGERLLHVEEELTWQGRTAWKLAQYDLKTDPGSSPGFEIATIYISQDADGLDKWVDTAAGGEWRRILSPQSSAFDNNTFLMAGGPAHDEGTELTSDVSVSTLSGSYSAVLARHEFEQTGSFATEDIFEERAEYYADGVGLVRAAWDYSFDDNDPSGTDLMSVGLVDLKGVDSGPTVLAEAEPNDDGTAGASQHAAPDTIVEAETHFSDPGRIVADVNVAPDFNGLQSLQDWYRLELSASGARHVALVYDSFNDANSHFDDLDLYLFREGAGGALTFIARSVLDPATSEGRDGEWIAANLAAGTYYIAVQAWNTPTDSVQYSMAVR